MERITIMLFLLLTSFGFAQSGQYVMWEYNNPYDGRNNSSRFFSLDLKSNGKFTLDIFYWKHAKEDCKKVVGMWKVENDTVILKDNSATLRYLVQNNSIIAQNFGKEKRNYYFDKLINLDFLLKLNDGSMEDHTKQNWLNQSKKSCR